MNRYRYDTGSVIDQETGDILTEKQVVNRLNRQDRLIKIKTRVNEAMVDELNKQINNSEGELKQALVNVANIRLDVNKNDL